MSYVVVPHLALYMNIEISVNNDNHHNNTIINLNSAIITVQLITATFLQPPLIQITVNSLRSQKFIITENLDFWKTFFNVS